MFKRKSSTGFTIAELLIVIVVIGILATLTIVAYNGISRNAAIAILKSDLSSASTQLDYLEADTGDYPADSTAIKHSKDVTYQYTSTPGSHSYCLTASNQYSEYYISSDNRIPQEGLCPGHVSQIGVESQILWSSISTGATHSCAIDSGGIAYCWGSDSFGQLGNDSSTTNKSIPTLVDDSSFNGTVTSISAGQYHTCATTSSGTAYCWGSDSYGQLGNDSSLSNRSTPASVNTSSFTGTVTSISAGSVHTCATTSDAKIYCWGEDSAGELGNNALLVDQPTPVQVDTSTFTGTVISVSAGSYGTCANTSDGKAYCWGYYGNGQLGDGRIADPEGDGAQPTPVQVDSSSMTGTITSISTGNSHSCATVSSGDAYCWGYALDGELGYTYWPDEIVSTPVQVDRSNMTGTITAITAGYRHTCVATSDGKAYCTGIDNRGQLGNVSASYSQAIPIQVDSSSFTGTVTSISADEWHTCATLSDYRSYCWGDSGQGRLGNTSADTYQLTPIRVSEP